MSIRASVAERLIVFAGPRLVPEHQNEEALAELLKHIWEPCSDDLLNILANCFGDTNSLERVIEQFVTAKRMALDMRMARPHFYFNTSVMALTVVMTSVSCLMNNEERFGTAPKTFGFLTALATAGGVMDQRLFDIEKHQLGSTLNRLFASKLFGLREIEGDPKAPPEIVIPPEAAAAINHLWGTILISDPVASEYKKALLQSFNQRPGP